MKNIAIFASGSGTNAENIYNVFKNGNRVRVPLVIYDRKNAGVAERMGKYPDVRTIYIPRDVWKNNPTEIVDLLKNDNIDLVVLAGFLRVIPPALTEEYAGRMINIHPSLLPSYGGMGMYGLKVHEAVIAAGEKESGVTVHYVSDEVDGGEILMQERIDVLPGDTPEALQERIHKIEYSIFPRAIVAALNKLNENQFPPATPPAIQEPPTPPTYIPACDEAAIAVSNNIDAEAVEAAAEAEVAVEENREALTPPSIAGITPPPTPPAQEWAETLGVTYDEEKLNQAYNGTEGVAEEPDAATEPSQESSLQNESSRKSNKEERPAPSSYLGWSIAMTLICCLPAGIVAIIYASQVNDKYHYGDYDGAVKASERAQLWIIISFILGLLANTLMLPMMIIG